jgi:hypothetical protein
MGSICELGGVDDPNTHHHRWLLTPFGTKSPIMTLDAIILDQ